MLVQEEITNQIAVGNCKDVLQRLPANSVQLTVTSPPYRNAIDYDSHASGSNAYYRGKLNLDTNDYLKDMTDILGDKLYHVTKEEIYFCIIISNEVVNISIVSIPHIQNSILVQPFGIWYILNVIILNYYIGCTF